MKNYKVRKRLISVGRDYDVEDEDGQIRFKIDGKIRFARTFDIKDGSGDVLVAVREKLLSISTIFEIKRRGVLIATVERLTYADQSSAKFDIKINGRKEIDADGNFHSERGFQIKRGEAIIGTVSRKPLTAIQEIFYISLAPDEDQSLILGIAMSIVEMVPFRGEQHS